MRYIQTLNGIWDFAFTEEMGPEALLGFRDPLKTYWTEE